MATDVILPRVDMDMTTGRISHWFAKAGERIEKGAPLFEIETDKAAMEIDAPASGRVQIIVTVGTQVPVGSTVGWILADGEGEVTAIASDGLPDVAEDGVPGSVDAVEAPLPASDAAPESGQIRATPLSRRLAATHGLDLADIPGTGPNGRVQAADVEALIGKSTANPDNSEDILNGAWLRQGAGSGAGDPIILIHGFGSDLGGWRPFVQGVTTDRAIYAVDLPGHGGSSLGASRTVSDMANRVVETLLGAGIKGGHLVGHSLGGAVATMVAADSRIAARSLMLIAPGGLGPDINAGFVNGFAAAEHEDSIAAWMRELVFDGAIMTPALIKATVKARAAAASHETLSVLAKSLFPDGTQATNVVDLLRGLKVPTRAVFGRLDRIVPVAHASRLGGMVAVHVFDDVGHLPHYERRDEVAALFLQHIRSAG